MTTTEAITQCLRNTRVDDLSNVSGGDAACLVRALNEAVQDYFDLAPDVHKRTTFSHYLAAPATLSGTIDLAQGETVVSSGTPFTTAQRGCTIVLEGDPTHNEIVSTTAVLRPYLGSSAAPLDGTVYYDAIPITDFAIEHFVSHPRLTTLTQEERELARVYPQGNGDGWWTDLCEGDGLPRYYRVDYVGGSVQNENDALVIIRVAPTPTAAMSVTFEADVRPVAYALTALHDARQLPISRTRANHLLPLIEAHLIGTPIWTGSPGATSRVREREQEARRLCALVTPDFARPAHRHGTAPGY